MKKAKAKKTNKASGNPLNSPAAGNPGEKAPEEKKPPGRPSVMTREVEDHICEQIAMGRSLVSILQEVGMPSYMTVCRHLKDTEGVEDGFCERYARAREDQADYLADEIIQIADDGRNDTYVDEEGRVRTDHDVVQRSRLRVDARKFIAAKLKPKKYGDRLALTDPDGKGLLSHLKEMTDGELDEEIARTEDEIES